MHKICSVTDAQELKWLPMQNNWNYIDSQDLKRLLSIFTKSKIASLLETKTRLRTLKKQNYVNVSIPKD